MELLMQYKRLSIITDPSSWLNEHIKKFISSLQSFSEEVFWSHTLKDLKESEVIFYLSFSKIAPREYLLLGKHNVVVHGSALPLGKGWSPLTWQIIAGKNKIPMTLFEANEDLDSGLIYLQEMMNFEGHELINEMRIVQADCTFNMCLEFLKNYERVVKNAKKQTGESSFYRKRTQADSKLDVNNTLLELFNLLRTVDNEKYPAFFEHLGHTYELKITKLK